MTLNKGNLFRDSLSKFVVTRWYIPGGCDYDNATPITAFFADEADAHAYAKHWEMPPEMASLLTIAQYDTCIARASQNYNAYKQRYHADFEETITKYDVGYHHGEG